MKQADYLQKEQEIERDKDLDPQLERAHHLRLMDGFGRVARKLRISVTDRCNLRCVYCMPSDNLNWMEQDSILNYEEIARLTAIFVSLGIDKIRITGGEPTVRPHITNLIESISKINGVKSISMTTNGLLLQENVTELKRAGLAGVNISLDTFRRDRFKSINGIDGLERVLASIKAVDLAGLKLKINTVIIRGWNEDEVIDFAKYSRDTGHTVRFIEFMPLDGTGIWKPELVVSKKEMISMINSNINDLVPLHNDISEPAMLYTFTDSKGIVGFIPSMTEPFCKYCDRIRLTSDGRLLTCLFERLGYNLRDLLRDGKPDSHIRRYILESIQKKPEGIITVIRNKALRPSLNLMNRIGG
ncbi:MAG TPA: GTP 3',8-cyclase MoaA [Nitrososphaeraceae archaeon]|nr:GTP 3',8-cyclase MoaA [Nitrososphaeraceae archaeon]